MTTLFVNIETPDDNNAGLLVKKQYDHVFKKELYADSKIYEEIYKYFNTLDKKTKVVTISSDTVCSYATIAGLNEKYMIRESEKQFDSELRIIYFDALPDLGIDDETPAENKIMSSLMRFYNMNICTTKLTLNPTQVAYVGLQNKFITESEEVLLKESGVMYFNLETVNKKGLDNILDVILHEFRNHPIHVCIDLKVFESITAPSVQRCNKNMKDGLKIGDMNIIGHKLRNKINTLDIMGFNDKIDNKDNTLTTLTSEIIRRLFVQIFDVKTKSINIFTEDTRFLIYRPVDQKSEQDIGWYIVRGLDVKERDELIKQIGVDNMITINMTNDDGEEMDCYITTTTMNEQNEKSFFTALTINDCCLTYQEKMYMGFELINK